MRGLVKVTALVLALTGTPLVHASSFNTADVLKTTLEGFQSCVLDTWRPSGICVWISCTLFVCRIDLSPRYTNDAVELLVQSYHDASEEPWAESALINRGVLGQPGSLVVSSILSALGSPVSSVAGGQGVESHRGQHNNYVMRLVDAYGHPALLFSDIDQLVDPSSWPSLDSYGSIVDFANNLPTEIADVFDSDDFDIFNPDWSVVDASSLLDTLTETDIASLYGIEKVLDAGCDGIGQPTPIPNPDYDPDGSCEVMVIGGEEYCSGNEEYITPDLACEMNWASPIPSVYQVASDFTAAQVASVTGSDITSFVTVFDTADADDLAQLPATLDLTSYLDWLFCTPELTPLYPYFISNLDTIAWRFGIPESILPQSLLPIGNELGTTTFNYGPYYPRIGSQINHDALSEGALSAFRAVHVVTRENQAHVYTTTAQEPEDGFWPPGPLTETNGTWQMVYPRSDSSCTYFPYPSSAGSSYRASNEAYAWNFYREYSCCAKAGDDLFFTITF